MLLTRERQLVRTLWERGPASRFELSRATDLSPNAVGAAAEALLRQRILREGAPQSGNGAGRPRVPLELNPDGPGLVGLAINPGGVERCTISPRGALRGRPASRTITQPRRLLGSARQLLQQGLARDTLGIGVSITGYIDSPGRRVLFSSALPQLPPTSLDPLCQVAGKRAIVFENDLNALAARWLLSHRAQQQQDVLLVEIGDGRLGAALLFAGRPNRGCITGGCELGHLRLPVPTERCYCGHQGCLERIVSSTFLSARAKHKRSLFQDAAALDQVGRPSPHLLEVVTHLATGLANAVQLVRPHRLVIVSPMIRSATFADLLLRYTRARILTALVDHVRIDLWDEPAVGSAETAAWLALAEFIYGGWSPAATAVTAAAAG